MWIVLFFIVWFIIGSLSAASKGDMSGIEIIIKIVIFLFLFFGFGYLVTSCGS